MFSILSWVIFGAIVGWVAKKLYPGDEGISGWQTVALGVTGSFVGGGINWLIGWGREGFSSAGLLMSIVGAVVCCYLYVNRSGLFAQATALMEKVKSWFGGKSGE